MDIKLKKIEKHFFINGNQLFNGSYTDNIGKRKTMEDYTVAYGEIFGSKTQYYGLFDGHGGNKISNLASQTFHEIIKEKYLINKNLFEILPLCFKEWNEKYTNDSNMCGSTASIVLIIENEIFFANIGDSRILFIYNNEIIKFSKDHNCFNEEEKELIISKGGQIINNKVEGILSLTRCFGDNILSHLILTEPFIDKLERKDNMKLIIASDGIWEILNNEEILNICLNLIEPSEITKKIKNEILNKGFNDNISILCVDLKFK